jgi:xanthine dehydrogenase accessory factor
MRNAEVLRLASDLAGRGEPFALATVVWRRSPSSSREGSKAVVTPDGRIRGWLGGACAEPTVIREAQRAIADRRPRLMFLGPPEELAARGHDGVIAVPIACQSEGAMEVYVEPMIPVPQLVAIGRSPAVDALARLASALGWETVVVDDGGRTEDHPGVERVETSLDLQDIDVRTGAFVIVATQGHYDEDALERALATPAGYVGLVASRKRAEAVLGYLRDRGVAEDALARVRAPAGLDLGRVENEEIAVAILAELVQERARARPLAEPAVEARHEAIDPVCGMTVDVATARHRTVHDGRTLYFCSVSCQQRFEEDPARFEAAPA